MPFFKLYIASIDCIVVIICMSMSVREDASLMAAMYSILNGKCILICILEEVTAEVSRDAVTTLAESRQMRISYQWFMFS